MSDAGWFQDGLTPLWVYKKPIVPGCGTLEILGAVRKSYHNYYEWWCWESRFFPGWKDGHGFEKTKHEAKMRVEKGWL